MKILEKALGAGTPITINGQDWVVTPLTVADYIELGRHVAMLLPAGVAVPENPLDAFDSGDAGHVMTVAWLMMRRADPSLPPLRRANQWFTLTKGDVDQILREHYDVTGRADVLSEILQASGIFPSAAEVAAAEEAAKADSKNDPAPDGALKSKVYPTGSRKARLTSRSGAPGAMKES